MAARTLALAAGGRARAAAAAAARLQPLAPPLGRLFPCPAASLLLPRAPPLLGPRGPGASRLRPLAPASFHPLAFSFSSESTAKGVGGQDPGEGGDKDKGDGGAGEKKRKEAARAAIDAGAKNGAKTPDASGAEVPKKTHPDNAFTAGELSKKQPPGDGGEKTEEEAARAFDAGAKNGANKLDAAAAEDPKKTHLSGDDPTASEIPEKQPPGDGGEKMKKEGALAIDAGAEKGMKKPDAAAAELANKTRPGDDSSAGDLSNDQPPGDVPEDAGNPEECKGVIFNDNPSAELANKGHAHAGDLSPPRAPATPPSGELPAPSDLSQPRTPAVSPCPPTSELPASGNVSGGPNPKSAEHTLTEAEENVLKLIRAQIKETEENVLKLIRAQSKETEENVLKLIRAQSKEGGRLLECYSNIQIENIRISGRSQTIFILCGVFLELAIVGVQFAVEKARDKIHAMSGDKKTKELMWNIYGTAFGYIGHMIASPVIFVGRALGAGAEKVGEKMVAIGKGIGARLGLVKVVKVVEGGRVEGGVQLKQVEPLWMEGLLIWCP